MRVIEATYQDCQSGRLTDLKILRRMTSSPNTEIDRMNVEKALLILAPMGCKLIHRREYDRKRYPRVVE